MTVTTIITLILAGGAILLLALGYIAIYKVWRQIDACYSIVPKDESEKLKKLIEIAEENHVKLEDLRRRNERNRHSGNDS